MPPVAYERFEELGPTYIKMGQLYTRADWLNPEFIEELSIYRTRYLLSLEQVQAILAEEDRSGAGLQLLIPSLLLLLP